MVYAAVYLKIVVKRPHSVYGEVERSAQRGGGKGDAAVINNERSTCVRREHTPHLELSGVLASKQKEGDMFGGPKEEDWKSEKTYIREKQGRIYQ